jgi:hypothetical protein
MVIVEIYEMHFDVKTGERRGRRDRFVYRPAASVISRVLQQERTKQVSRRSAPARSDWAGVVQRNAWAYARARGSDCKIGRYVIAAIVLRKTMFWFSVFAIMYQAGTGGRDSNYWSYCRFGSNRYSSSLASACWRSPALQVPIWALCTLGLV